MSGLTLAAAASGAVNPLWYLTRATGLVSFGLLTATMVLGVLSAHRVSSPRWPRFVSQGLHRNLSLLAVAFLAVHILTTLLDSYVAISWWAVVLPFASSYRPVWVSAGTVALDLLLLVLLTSLLRSLFGHRRWRAIHWGAYAVWPFALLHYLGSGTDARTWFGRAVALGAVALVGGAALTRLAARPAPYRRLQACDDATPVTPVLSRESRAWDGAPEPGLGRPVGSGDDGVGGGGRPAGGVGVCAGGGVAAPGGHPAAGRHRWQ